MIRASAALLLLLLLVGAELSAQRRPSLSFVDITAAVGIDWVQRDSGLQMGAGAAFLDFDQDGWQDVLLAGGDGTAPRLYRNEGGRSFRAVPEARFAASSGADYLCTAVADFDNDGDPDVFFGRFGTNLLYRNDGGGVFTDITSPALAGSPLGFTTAACFGDFDGDGVLDLYLGNYIAVPSYFPNHTPTPNVLLRGRGDGSFVDVTSAVTAGAGTALATIWTDYDADGDVDLFVGNDFGAFVEPNRLYRNDGAGFVDVSVATRFDAAIYCMGIATGDIDRDGDFDYYFTNLGRNVMLRNDGGVFADITAATRTELTFDPDTSPPLFATSWGAGFRDFDCDGWLDLYVSNGHIPADPSIANGTRTRSVLLRHDGHALSFTRVGLYDDGIGRGAAFADFDNDGDVDILQANVDGAPTLLRNDSPRRGHWMKVRLHGRLSNRDALGARIEVDVGEFRACREVSRNDSFESSSEVVAQFGLGVASRVRSVRVRWPSGVRQRLYDLTVDTTIDLAEPIVTVDRARLSSLGLPFGGTLWVLSADLVAHGDRAVAVVVRPQVEDPVSRRRIWSGRARSVLVAPGARAELVETVWVPARAPWPDDAKLIWSASDRGSAMDQQRVGRTADSR